MFRILIAEDDKGTRRLMEDTLADAGYEPICISVNQSRLLFYQSDYVERLCAVMDRYHIPHGYIQLEILEGLAIENIEQMNKTLAQLHEKGFRLSLDDFGSGYSSLNTLKDLPIDELKLEEPEIMKQGGRYGVRLKASAPSIHMIRADIETAVSPIVGNEKQSEDMVNYLLQEFEGDTSKIWQSNIFGRSFHELVNEDLQAKLKRMPEDARRKLQETLTRIINEGSGGLICIIL